MLVDVSADEYYVGTFATDAREYVVLVEWPALILEDNSWKILNPLDREVLGDKNDLGNTRVYTMVPKHTVLTYSHAKHNRGPVVFTDIYATMKDNNGNEITLNISALCEPHPEDSYRINIRGGITKSIPRAVQYLGPNRQFLVPLAEFEQGKLQ
ncbi:MAG TPA: hypothetical protein PKD64_13430 [Pirellulaceae bacterium]|nr:hypothetical protein [Pirellulaceae bacterium]HMO93189.1 hypothetical protein [Pirellulaceae bacterium]HMP69982.1 hypothetical protein [Pirellulaceae bacterium]